MPISEMRIHHSLESSAFFLHLTRQVDGFDPNAGSQSRSPFLAVSPSTDAHVYRSVILCSLCISSPLTSSQSTGILSTLS